MTKLREYKTSPNKFSSHHFLITTFAILFLLSKTTFADDEVLSWQQCVDLATNNNNNLKSAIANEKTTLYQKDASASGFLPQATANLSSSRGSSAAGGVDQTYTESLNVSQNLFSGFSDTGKFDQAKANNLISKANINIVKAQVSYDLKSSYQSFVYAKETVELLDNIIHRREDNLRIIELRFKGGMENKGSLLLAQAYLEQAKYDRLQGSNLIESARAGLCKAIGLGECNQFDIKDSIPINAPKDNQINLSEVIETTPTHEQAMAQEKAAEAGITIAKSGFFPSLDLNLSKGQTGTTFVPQNDYWAVGMNLSLPFFTGGRDYYGTRSAYSKTLEAKENRKTIDQQILVDLKKNYNSYIESVAKLKVDENFEKAAKVRADIARSKYNNGLLNFEDWDLVETDLINREKSYLQSKRDRVLNEASWEQIQGKGVFYNE